MPFDALTIAAVRQELADRLVGGRVQNIIMPGPLTLSLEVYRAGTGRTHLILSAHPQYARAHLTTISPDRDPEQHPPLLLLLRKYVRGGTLLDVAQPRHERILALSIAKRFHPDKHQEYHFERDFGSTSHSYVPDEYAPEEYPPDRPDEGAPVVKVQLVVEVMGRLSNIVLVKEEGIVLDSIKRIPPTLSRYRTILPNRPYVPPPPPDKRDPLRANTNVLSLELLKALDADPEVPVWKGLVDGFAAVSPTLAREVTYQALGDYGVAAARVARDPGQLQKLLDRLQAMFALEQTGGWQPVVAWHTHHGGHPRPVEFAPYPLTHLAAQGAELARHDSISEAIESYYTSVQTLTFTDHAALKAHIRAEIEELKGREERRLSALRQEYRRAESLDELRRKGEYILAFMHTLSPGQRLLHVPEEGLTIELDPALTPVENAQALFKEYRKARSALEGLPAKIAEAEMHARFYDELLTSLELANGYDEIMAVRAELDRARAAGPPATAQGTTSKGESRGGKGKAPAQRKLLQPLKLQTKRGAQMLVGRTSSQSHTATFHLAGPDDLWFHALGVPGAHVILRASGGIGITDEDIKEAAATAAAYSKARNEPQVDVVYTEKRHVRPVPGAPPGLVTYRNERVIRVAPRRPEEVSPR
jgi:predicted ribosome quality control (RQC) complex YloA/Tae2 family protein